MRDPGFQAQERLLEDSIRAGCYNRCESCGPADAGEARKRVLGGGHVEDINKHQVKDIEAVTVPAQMYEQIAG